jgi:transposase
MQGKKRYTEKLFTSFQLSERVPTHNKYRRLMDILDLGFVHGATAHLYGKTGPPSLDAEVFFKLMLVSYMEGITSDRQLVEHCALRMDILFFLGYDIDEPLPWHSTVSRTRQLFPRELFEEVFNKVFSLCVESGLVDGSGQAVDSATCKANASLGNMVDWGKVRSFLDRGMEENLGDPSPVEKKDKKGGKGNGSNKAKRSLTDPDARIISRPGKGTTLGYHCNAAVDTKGHVITHVQADMGDQRDSDCLRGIVGKARERLAENGLAIEAVLADTNYSSGENYAWLEQQGITGWVPVFGQFKKEREGFAYDGNSDTFTCPRGKHLTLRREYTDKRGNDYKLYAARTADCSGCPLKKACAGANTYKSINTSAYHREYRRALDRQESHAGRRMARVRSSRVEPVLGTLMNTHSLRKLRSRGLEAADKCMKMAGAVYNLKKLLVLRQKPGQAMGMAIKKAEKGQEMLENVLLRLTGCMGRKGGYNLKNNLLPA